MFREESGTHLPIPNPCLQAICGQHSEVGRLSLKHGKAEACINIQFLYKHAHEYPLLTLPEAKQGFASGKPSFCFILKTLELRANFQCITMQGNCLVII